MKNYILIPTLITFIFSCGCLNVNSKRGDEKQAEITLSACEFDSLKNVLQGLGICLNIDAQKWADTLKVNPTVVTDWRYFYDPTYFKAYKMNNNTPCQNLFLLEVSINHGSGEYDNYIIRKEKQGYQIVTEFKGYLSDIIVTNDDYKLTYRMYVKHNLSCLVTGTFDRNKVRTDTVLSNDSLCMNIFTKGKSW
jgi:hypothetical protein